MVHGTNGLHVVRIVNGTNSLVIILEVGGISRISRGVRSTNWYIRKIQSVFPHFQISRIAYWKNIVPYSIITGLWSSIAEISPKLPLYYYLLFYLLWKIVQTNCTCTNTNIPHLPVSINAAQLNSTQMPNSISLCLEISSESLK